MMEIKLYLEDSKNRINTITIDYHSDLDMFEYTNKIGSKYKIDGIPETFTLINYEKV